MSEIELQTWQDHATDTLRLKARRWDDEGGKHGVIYAFPVEDVEGGMEPVPVAAEYPVHLVEEEPKPSVLAAVHMLMDIARDVSPEDAAFMRRTYSSAAFVAEFRTVRVRTRRQAGHSHAVVALARELRALVITPYTSQGDQLLARGSKNVFSETQIRSGSHRGRMVDAIIVDCASHFKDLQEVLTQTVPCLTQSEDPWVILLG